MDSTLLALADFGPINQRQDLHDELDELARKIEVEIERTEARLDELPDYQDRPQRVGGTIDVDTLINA